MLKSRIKSGIAGKIIVSSNITINPKQLRMKSVLHPDLWMSLSTLDILDINSLLLFFWVTHLSDVLKSETAFFKHVRLSSIIEVIIPPQSKSFYCILLDSETCKLSHDHTRSMSDEIHKLFYKWAFGLHTFIFHDL
jgi:hypothetical protein